MADSRVWRRRVDGEWVTFLGIAAVPGNSLIAAFTAVPNAATAADFDVTFDGSASSGGSAGLVDFSWNFGDGNTQSGGLSQGDIGTRTTYSFGQPGAYTVTLTVTAADGGTASQTRTVIVTSNTLPYIESFPGADGSPWPQAWLTRSVAGATGGVATIQGGMGRLTAPTSQGWGYAQQEALLNGTPFDNFEVRLTLAPTGGQREAYFLIAGAADNGEWAGNEFLPNNGYNLTFSIYSPGEYGNPTTGSLTMEKTVSGNKTTLVNETFLPGGATTGTRYGVRFRRVGTLLQARAWPESTAEPSTWTVQVTDSGAQPPAGKLLLRGGNGGDNSAYTWDLDNLALFTQSMLPYTEAFLGVDGDDPWPAVWLPSTTAVISGGGGRLAAAHSSYAGAAARLAIPDTSDVEVTGTVVGAVDGPEQYVEITLNASGDWRTTTNSIGGYTTQTGYLFCINYDGSSATADLYTEDADGEHLVLTGRNRGTPNRGTTRYRFRFQRLGTWLRARLWIDGTAEPTIWDDEWQIPTAQTHYNTGAVVLGVQAGNSGQGGDFTWGDVTVSVPGAPPATPPPTVTFTPSVSGLTVTATATTTGAINSYLWDFGDGQRLSSQSVTHTYAAGGSYTIKCTVVATDSQSGSSTQTVRVTTTTVTKPTANFNSSLASDNVTDTFTSTSVVGTYPITTYTWTFGDGGTASGSANASHVYTQTSAAQNFVVTLTVKDSAGNQASASKTITIPAQVIVPVPSGNGAPGVNRLGNNTQQTGTGITTIQNLSGSDLTAKIKAAGAAMVSFGVGTYTWNDFQHGLDGAASPSGINASGTQMLSGTTKGMLGAGSTKSILQMNPNTSTKAGLVPSTGTNQLVYIDGNSLPNGFVWDGLDMVGTAQGHLYNGMRLHNPGNITFSNSTFSGIPGSGGTPPGETSAWSVYIQAATSTVNVTRCTFDGRQNGSPVTSALLATNTTGGVINITDCLFRNNLGSAGPTIWELQAGGTINLIRPVTQKLHRNVGNEAQAGTINIYDPLFDDPVPGEDDIRVTWTSNYNSGTINVYFTAQSNWNAFIAARTNKKILTQCTTKQNYGGSAGGAYTGSNRIIDHLHLFIAGKEQTLANYWQVSGS